MMENEGVVLAAWPAEAADAVVPADSDGEIDQRWGHMAAWQAGAVPGECGGAGSGESLSLP